MGHAKMQLAQSIVRCQPRIRFDLVQEGNRITGSIPPMSGAMSLMSFTAGSNRLTGPIPPDWWQLPALQIFSLAGNSLTGSIPAAAYASVIASANNAFQTIDFSNNQLTGTIPMGLISQPIRVCASLSPMCLQHALSSYKQLKSKDGAVASSCATLPAMPSIRARSTHQAVLLLYPYSIQQSTSSSTARAS